jgi:hypothetical protein
MMAKTRYSVLEEAIGGALKRSGGDVSCEGPGSWKLTPKVKSDQAVEVRLQDDWVLCSVEVPAVFDDVEMYMQVNSLLPGGCKVALDSKHMAAVLREEIPVADGEDMSKACGEAIANLLSAQKLLAKQRQSQPKSGSTRRTRKRWSRSVTKDFADTLDEVCKVAGWESSERDGGQLVVSLEHRNGTHTAFVEAQEGDCYRIRVHLAQYKRLSEVSHRAIAAFLLIANGVIRFVRAAFERSADGLCTFFEVRISERLSVEVLDLALSALAVSSATYGLELRALGDERVAWRYLTARGLAAATDGTDFVCG